MNDSPPEAQLTAADQRKINRVLDKLRRAGQPLQTTHGGMVGIDSAGRTYMRERGAGNVRVQIGEDGQPMRIIRWSKARRRAEKRKRVAAKFGR